MVSNNSVLVPSVQELVKETRSESVPLRYLRSDDDKVILEDSDQILEIPVIDFGNLTSEESMESELKKLDSACRDWGFFQLINHGVDTGFLDKFKAETHDFFNLPLEEKMKFWQKKGETEGFGQIFDVSGKQKLDWSDIFHMTLLPRRFRKPHLFPELPLPFRDTLDEYSAKVESITKSLLEKFGTVLKVNPEELNGLFDDGLQLLRMNYYPPCPKPDQVIGLTPHSDPAGLTLLLQVNEVEGLQFWKNGKWVSVKPLPNAFIINVGDMLEIITNGVYPSITHRVVVNSEKERISIGIFSDPRLDALLAPAKNLISEETPTKFTSLTTEDFLKRLLARTLDAKPILDELRI